MEPEQVNISLPEGNSTAISIYSPETTSENSPVLIIFPAMGVKGSYYRPLAESLLAKGCIVVITDLRGHGASNLRPSRKTDFGYESMITQDYDAIIQKINHRFPENPQYLLGHSLGGQLSCLYLSRYQTGVKGLILICCCSVYYKGWKGFMRYGTLFFTQFFGLVARLLGYFPGKKLGFGGLEARTLMKDWSKQARTGYYRLANSDFDYEAALAHFKVPTLVITLEGDNFAPPEAAKNLYRKFHPDAQITHRHFAQKRAGRKSSKSLFLGKKC